MILMIDNYDSFTYNLVQYLYMLNQEVTVRRNDEITVEEAMAMNPEFIVISPGPGKPADAGIIIPLIKACAGKISMLGICLGHQAIG
ncbi:MAG: anthranilate synthase component II, partial [Victivallaceae bacterium]